MFTSYEGNNCIIYTYGLAMMWISRMFNPSKVISPRALQLSMFTPYESNNCILLYYAIRSVIVWCHKKHYCIVREEGLLHSVITSIILEYLQKWHKRQYCIVREEWLLHWVIASIILLCRQRRQKNCYCIVTQEVVLHCERKCVIVLWH